MKAYIGPVLFPVFVVIYCYDTILKRRKSSNKMKEIFMGKLIDFYKSAESDERLRLDLEAANRNFAEKEAVKPGSVDRESVIAETIRLAGNHGVIPVPHRF
jgi:hypothetical protein